MNSFIFSAGLIAFISLQETYCADSPVIEPPGEKWYLENSPFSIKCHYNSSTPLTEADKTELKFYNKFESETLGTNLGFDAPIHSMPTEKTITVELRKSMIKARDAGKYVCKYRSSSATTQADVVVVQVEKEKTEYDLEKEDKLDYTLSCKFTPIKDEDLDLSKRDSSIKWSKDGAVLSASKYNFTNHGANLTIIKAAWEDIGLYSCEYNTNLENSQPVVVASTVAFEGQPRVEKMQTSKNFVQGDPMTLKCPISGYPEPEVIWKKDGAELQKTDYIIFSNENNITNAVLKIISLDFKDKGTYSCSGNSTIGASNNVDGILIRVKDKLAALWPFLAIVAEVIILCIIIFIYEKKRSKAMEDEADGVDDNIPNADDHKGKDVRQRSVRT